MVSDETLANVVGGKTARACDSCIRKRARWYCAADDAFLCESCDGLVHAANPLARRHERIPLKTTSFELETPPAWHHGFTRKARTPRHGRRNAIHRRKSKPEDSVRNPVHHLVPEMATDRTTSHEEINEEQFLYRVPIFDGSDHQPEATWRGFLQSDMELANFAADVENLLGKGVVEESFDMEGSCGRVKVEEDEEDDDDLEINQFHTEIDMTREPLFELNFDFDSPQITVKESEDYEVKKKVLLTLDYDRVITAWADQKSPWTTADRPELNPHNYWPDCMGASGTLHYPYGGDMGITNGQTMTMTADGGRKARVTRYREKRRTRLFSKKIRYEVRKLNAEKRPRMKGRFVKRADFAEPIYPLLNN